MDMPPSAPNCLANNNYYLETSASFDLTLDLSVDSQRTSSSSHQTSQDDMVVEDTTIAEFINDLKKFGENSTRKRVKKPTYNPTKRITRNDSSSLIL